MHSMYASPRLGALLSGANVVNANFFRVNTENLPRRIYNYAVKVFMYDIKENDWSPDDCAGTEDDRILWTMYNKLIAKHPEWEISSGRIGCAYSGRSTMFTTGPLLIPEGVVNKNGEPYYEDDVALTNTDGKSLVIYCAYDVYMLCIVVYAYLALVFMLSIHIFRLCVHTMCLTYQARSYVCYIYLYIYYVYLTLSRL